MSRAGVLNCLFLLTGSVILGLGCSQKVAADPPMVAKGQIVDEDESIVSDGKGAPNPKVENGVVYDKATIKAAHVKTLIVPDNATVERIDSKGEIELYIKRTQGFHGHPPEPMPLKAIRKKMGCATRMEAGKATIATFGEFSTKEGGASLKLLIRVPKALSVETKEGLSGANSAGQGKQEADKKDGYWYGPTAPGEGWKAIPTEPDPKRTVK
jgi:hypothetical protein